MANPLIPLSKTWYSAPALQTIQNRCSIKLLFYAVSFLWQMIIFSYMYGLTETTIADFNANDMPEVAIGQPPEAAAMILAAMPRDERHVVSLWSELECFAGSVNHVVIASAYWARPVLDKVVSEARKNIPHFASGQVTIETRFFDNRRYDAGLWCDGLQGLYSKSSNSSSTANRGSLKQEEKEFNHFLLLNDSVFALRPFDGILQDLRSTKNRAFTSLNYQYDENGTYWLESVFRGFNVNGLEVFMNNSCVPSTHSAYCPELGPEQKYKRKQCIIKNHELNLAYKFPPYPPNSEGGPDRVTRGLFGGRVPRSMNRYYTNWIQDRKYWKYLVEKENFPVAKANEDTGHIPDIHNEKLLQPCLVHLDLSLLSELDFGSAETVV